MKPLTEYEKNLAFESGSGCARHKKTHFRVEVGGVKLRKFVSVRRRMRVDAVTAVVVIEKFALRAPARTVTLAGTLATAVLLLDSVTMAPPVGAATVSVTVPVLPVPPTTLVGLTVTEDKVAAAGTGLTVSTAVRVTPPKVPEN